jgi:hypothetical protein
MFTKFWIVIFVFLLSIATNIFKLKFIEFGINWTDWLKWRLDLTHNKSQPYIHEPNFFFKFITNATKHRQKFHAPMTLKRKIPHITSIVIFHAYLKWQFKTSNVHVDKRSLQTLECFIKKININIFLNECTQENWIYSKSLKSHLKKILNLL